jgi:hypothetical protein
MWLIASMLLLLVASFAAFWALVVFSERIVGAGAAVRENIDPGPPRSAG